MARPLYARDMAKRLGLQGVPRFYLKRGGREWSGRCPACADPAGFHIREAGLRADFWCVACQDKAALTAAVARLAHAPKDAPTAPAPIARRRGDG